MIDVAVGIALAPDAEFLDLLGAVVHDDVDYYELTPETLVRADGSGALVPNGFHRAFLGLAERNGKFCVAHGVGYSLGSQSARDRPRKRAWLSRLREDHASFRFHWYTDHLGMTAPAGRAAALPLPLPMHEEAARIVRRSLAELRTVVPDVGLENSVSHFLVGNPLDEPRFLRRIVREPHTHLLLDLHNVYVMARNFGFDPREWLARADLGRVIEIHVSGGSDSDPAWLPSGLSLRLDSHDDAVPDEVFQLLEWTLPRARNVRGVTLERMEGTVDEHDVGAIREELSRVRRIVGKA